MVEALPLELKHKYEHRYCLKTSFEKNMNKFTDFEKVGLGLPGHCVIGGSDTKQLDKGSENGMFKRGLEEDNSKQKQ